MDDKLERLFKALDPSDEGSILEFHAELRRRGLSERGVLRKGYAIKNPDTGEWWDGSSFGSAKMMRVYFRIETALNLVKGGYRKVVEVSLVEDAEVPLPSYSRPRLRTLLIGLTNTMVQIRDLRVSELTGGSHPLVSTAYQQVGEICDELGERAELLPFLLTPETHHITGVYSALAKFHEHLSEMIRQENSPQSESPPREGTHLHCPACGGTNVLNRGTSAACGWCFHTWDLV